MKTTKHTPGPWKIENHVDSFAVRRITTHADHAEIPENRIVIETILSIHDGTLPNRANAALIAAAPEMLEALMQIDFAMASGQYHEIDTIKFREAIRKARGDK